MEYVPTFSPVQLRIGSFAVFEDELLKCLHENLSSIRLFMTFQAC